MRQTQHVGFVAHPSGTAASRKTATGADGEEEAEFIAMLNL